MSTRSYRQNCALAIALDLIGERWTLLIVRELLLGPRRFKDLEANLPGIGTNLLSARLARLADNGIVERRRPEGGHPSYRLTELGRGLKPAVTALIRWGMHFPERRAAALHARGEWNILPLRALFDARSGKDWRGAYRFVVDDNEILVECRHGELEPAAPETPVVGRIAMDSTTAARLASGALDAGSAVEAGALTASGNDQDLARFFAAFSRSISPSPDVA